MVRAQKMLVDIKENSATVLYASSLFHINKSVGVSDHLREHLIHHHIVNLECISVVINIDFSCET